MITSPLAVCSWSLRPTSPRDLCEKVSACGLSTVQLHLDPIRDGSWPEAAVVETLGTAGVRVVSGMFSMKGEDYTTLESIKRTGGVRQDTLWGDNFRAVEANGALAQRLGLSLVTFHAGFLPHTPGDALRRTMIDRVRQLAQLFAARGIRLALETGQESAPTLLGVLAELNASLTSRWHVGVNFDPANMILYGMGDPIDALRKLQPFVRQVHIKDAVATKQAGSWGEEVPVGTGGVDWPAFFKELRGTGVPMAIEREAGDNRIADITTAASLVRRLTEQSA